jgi:hypothetical protein
MSALFSLTFAVAQPVGLASYLLVRLRRPTPARQES